MTTVTVKWGKETVPDVKIPDGDDFAALQAELEARTGVLAARQKVMVKGFGMVKDSAGLSRAFEKGKLNRDGGSTVMLMGTAEKAVAKLAADAEKAKESVIFAEDLPEDDARRGGGAVALAPGLANLGNTCYFNSCVQALLSVPEVKQAVVDLPGELSAEASQNYNSLLLANAMAAQAAESGQGAGAGEAVQTALMEASQKSQMAGDADKNVALALRELAKELKETTKASVVPVQLLMFFRIAYPQFAARGESGIPMQQDAEEAYSQLIGILERELPQNPVRALFEGKMKDVRTLKGAAEGQEEAQTVLTPFDRMRCHISKDTNFLLEGLKEAMSEDLELNDRIYERNSQIAELPKALMVQFVRFFWKAGKAGPAMGLVGDLKSGSAGSKAKILRPVDMPRRLDLFTLCTEELQAKLKIGRVAMLAAEDAELFGDDKKGEANDGDATMDSAQPYEGNVTGEYELVAVISHKGRSADSGHYVAWVKDDSHKPAVAEAIKPGAKAEAANDEWLLFDDDVVTPVRWEPDVKQLSGKGGGDWHIAYMCLYATRNPPPGWIERTEKEQAEKEAAKEAEKEMDTTP